VVETLLYGGQEGRDPSREVRERDEFSSREVREREKPVGSG
jgi:hypothetical protein